MLDLSNRPKGIEMKDVEGYEGSYAITKDGDVWSYPRVWYCGTHNSVRRMHKGKWLRKKTDGKGMRYVDLMNNGARTPFRIHRMVAEAFLPKLSKDSVVIQIDGNSNNTNVSNLRWMPHKRYKTREVSQYKTDGTFIKTYPSLKQAGLANKISYQAIVRCIKGLCKSTNKSKYVWKFAS